MTRDDIIRMAKKAGLEVYSILEKQQVDWDCLIDDLQEFAALVAAAEREACAKVCDGWVSSGFHPATVIAEAIRARGETGATAMTRDDIDFHALMIAATVMLVVVVVTFLSALLVML